MKQVQVSGTWYDVEHVTEAGNNGTRAVMYDAGSGYGIVRIHDSDGRLREKPIVDDEGHEPTPHEPVRGVTLWDKYESTSKVDYSSVEIHVDGKYAGTGAGGRLEADALDEKWSVPFANPFYIQHASALRDFRDSIRVIRRAASDPPRTWTRAEIEAVLRAMVEPCVANRGEA